VEQPGGYGLFLFETLLILALVCGGAWVLLRVGLPRLFPVGKGTGPLRVVARLPLEPRRTLYLVEAGRKVLLLGSSEQGPLATLAELDASEVAALEVAAPPAPGLKGFLELLRSPRDRK
jgi:flagellar biosynthetic protein FliO